MGSILKNSSIKARISWAFGLVFLLLPGMILIGSHGMSSVTASLKTVYEDRAVPLAQIADVRNSFQRIRMRTMILENSRNAEEISELIAQIGAIQIQIESIWQDYLGTYLTPEEERIARDVEGAIDNYISIMAEALRSAQAGHDGTNTARMGSEGARAYAQLEESLSDLVALQVSVAAEEYSQATVSANRLTTAMTALGIAGGLGGLLIAVVITSSIVTPVIGLTAAMKRVSDGDLTTEIPARERKDEVGAMAAALAVFRDALQRNREMEDRAKAREAEAEAEQRAALAKMADEFESTVGGLVRQLSSSSAELEATARSLSSTAEETNMQSASVASAAEQTAANVQAVATATEQLAASSQEIGSQVAQAATRSAAAVDQARETNDLVSELSDSAQKIGEVIAMIRAIAEQTNLLALNATIEAARAGEAGKGFAVVAAEVKGLADQTAKATDQIATQITGMQGISEKSVAAIGAIAQQIEQMSALAGSVAAAVEEQQAATGEIARNVSEAARGTQEATGNISQVREASGHTASASEQLLTSANELSQNAGTLETEVSQFLQRVRAG